MQTGAYFGEDDIVRIKDDYNDLMKPKVIIVSGYLTPFKGTLELLKSKTKGDEFNYK